MADQKRIKLGALHATPKTIIVRDLPVANAAATTKIYLYTTHATPKNVIMRDPTAAPIPAGDTVNGALSATLDALTLSSAGQVVIDGDLVPTLGALTLSSAGQLVIDGDLAATLADLTAGSAGKVEIAAAEGTTLGALTLSAVGNVEIAAALAVTLDAVTLASDGTVTGEGATAQRNDDWENDVLSAWDGKRHSQRSRAYRVYIYGPTPKATEEKPKARTKVRRRRIEPLVEAIKEAVGPADRPRVEAILPAIVYAAPVSDAALVKALAAYVERQADEDDIEMLLLAA